MTRLASLAFGAALLFGPGWAFGQNTPTSPLSNNSASNPSSMHNEAQGSEGVGEGGLGSSNGKDEKPWRRYLPRTPGGWVGLLLGGSAAASLAYRRLHHY